MATTHSVTEYAAAQVFYWVGFNGLSYVLDVFIADTSALKYRGLAFAFSTCPFIATTFAGPAAAQSFLDTSGWRWGYGTFCIVTPVICAPFVGIFGYNTHLAKKKGVYIPTHVTSERTWYQSVLYYCIEFDGE